jgi:P27 family predicted phage terminase small subunit
MKGRKPKLFALDKQEGSPSRRKRKVPARQNGDFDPPFGLSELAAEEWKRIRAEAVWISAASAGLLALRCEAYAEWMQAREDIKKRGTLIETRNGDVKNPSLQIAREARAYLLRADAELGLTSCSEQRVNAPTKTPAVDAVEDALYG